MAGVGWRAARRPAHPFNSFCHAAAYEIPACEQTLAPTAPHSAVGSMNLSLITVDSMFVLLTESGVRSTDGTAVLVWVSWVLELTRLDGGVFLARTYMERATPAWAS